MKKPFFCDVSGCNKAYTTRFSLRRHIASHSAVKSHVCLLCFKSFTLAQYLKEHMYIHTQQKPFKCDFPGCSRTFRQAGKLSMHKKSHTVQIFDIERFKEHPYANKSGLVCKSSATNQVIKFSLKRSPKNSDCEESSDQTCSLDCNESNNEQSFDEEMSSPNHEIEAPDFATHEADHDDRSRCEPSVKQHDHSPMTNEKMTEEGSRCTIKISNKMMPVQQNKPEMADSSAKAPQAQVRTIEPLAAPTTTRSKLPFEMIVTKLCDSLEMPKMISRKQLPVPASFSEANSKLGINIPK